MLPTGSFGSCFFFLALPLSKSLAFPEPQCPLLNDRGIMTLDLLCTTENRRLYLELRTIESVN